MKNIPVFYTPDEIAEMLKVDPASVRRWVTKGVLDAYKIGGRIRVSQAQLDAFLQARLAPKQDGRTTEG